MRSPTVASRSSSTYDSATASPSSRSSRASSVDEYRPSESSSAMEVFQSIYSGRKSWKTLRGGEMVWPAELEAALIEGLELYQPDDSRETRLLGRFPMRNRFISEHIHRKTGKRRTAKQVGSRLQQLRETCTGQRLMDLLSPTRRQLGPNRSPHGSHYDSSSSNGGNSAPITPTDDVAPYNLARDQRAPTHHTFSIDILRRDELASPICPTDRPASALSSSTFAEDVIRLSDHARCIRDIDPTLTFISHVPITANSFFQVYADGSVVFSEMTTLSLCEMRSPENSSGADGGFLYSTPIVPNYWKTICESHDPTEYSIFQEVAQTGQDGASAIFTATFRFNYQTTSAYAAGAPFAVTDSQFDFTYEDLNCFVPEHPPQYGKSGGEHLYGYAYNDGSWLAPPLQRGELGKTLGGGPGQGFDMDSSPSSQPISPMPASFPDNLTDTANGVYHLNFELL